MGGNLITLKSVSVTKRVLLVRVSHGAGAYYGLLLVTEGHQILAVYRTIENLDDLFPDGEYDLVFELSPRFGRKLWEIYGIPGRSECKIHVANYPEQLEGCVGVGLAHQDVDGDGDIDLANSARALEDFHAIMYGAGRVKFRAVTV